MNQREFEVAFAEACYCAIINHRPLFIRPVLTVVRDMLADSPNITSADDMIDEVDRLFVKLKEAHPHLRRL